MASNSSVSQLSNSNVVDMSFQSSTCLTVSAAAASSSKNLKLKRQIGVVPRPEPLYCPFTALVPSTNDPIKAMVCHSWDAKNTTGKYIGLEFVLSDPQGNTIHCVARSSVAHCVVPKLQVGSIYNISRFTVFPNKYTYRLRHGDPFIIQFEGNTLIEKLDCSSDRDMLEMDATDGHTTLAIKTFANELVEVKPLETVELWKEEEEEDNIPEEYLNLIGQHTYLR